MTFTFVCGEDMKEELWGSEEIEGRRREKKKRKGGGEWSGVHAMK